MMFLRLEKHLKVNREMIASPNLCDRFTSDDLKRIGELCHQGWQRDEMSRSKWLDRMTTAMDLAMQYSPGKSWPWPNCSNVVFPIITLAALQFSARAYASLIQGTDIVKYRLTSQDPDGMLQQQADRISAHMSWQVMEEDKGWEEQIDRMLINTSIVGCVFLKDFFSGTDNCPITELVLARDLAINYSAKSVDTASRKTQLIKLYRNEIYERVQSDLFVDVLDYEWFKSLPPLQEPLRSTDARKGISPSAPDEDTPFQFLEQHRYLDLDGDGYAEPYIVTLETQSRCVTRIVARFDSEQAVKTRINGQIVQITPTEYFTKVPFIPAADGGIYDTGFGTFLGPVNEAVSTGINQLLDAGTMQNSMGGFLGRGAKIRGGVYTMAPWEWKRVDSTGDDLRKSLVPFPERQPSQVMYSLIEMLIGYAEKVASTVDQMVGKTPGQNTPAETSRNTMEQGMQVYSSIFKRIWRSQKESFKKRHMLNALHLPSEKRFGTKGNVIRQEDYKSNPNMVVPAADPNITSQGLRMQIADMLSQRAQAIPGYDRVAVEKKFLRAARVDDIDQVYPGPDKVPPLPNPKMQLEEMKLKAKEMELQFQSQKFVAELQETRKLNQANIYLIQAQVAEILAGVQDAKAQTKLKAFEIAIDAMEAHNDLLTGHIDRLQAMQGDGNESKSGSGGAGVPGVADPSGNPGAAGAAGAVAGGN